MSVPIWVRSSFIMRVMVVVQTSAAMSAKNTGNASPTALMIVTSFSKVAQPEFSSRVRTYRLSFSCSSASAFA